MLKITVPALALGMTGPVLLVSNMSMRQAIGPRATMSYPTSACHSQTSGNRNTLRCQVTP